MVFLALTAMLAMVAFFFYHRLIVMRLERYLQNFETEIDYLEDAIKHLRNQFEEKSLKVSIKSTKPAKRKRGRPINPNSIRQRKLKGGK